MLLSTSPMGTLLLFLASSAQLLSEPSRTLRNEGVSGHWDRSLLTKDVIERYGPHKITYAKYVQLREFYTFGRTHLNHFKVKVTKDGRVMTFPPKDGPFKTYGERRQRRVFLSIDYQYLPPLDQISDKLKVRLKEFKNFKKNKGGVDGFVTFMDRGWFPSSSRKELRHAGQLIFTFCNVSKIREGGEVQSREDKANLIMELLRMCPRLLGALDESYKENKDKFKYAPTQHPIYGAMYDQVKEVLSKELKQLPISNE
ncbi:hypothetical protein AKO1_000792 [Acrasis kona]|uniref:Uncharacterized protein n=1 Tax=Acrasis kona TaxID=1008807 RepID=A0AAW2ZDF0_9EUKA